MTDIALPEFDLDPETASLTATLNRHYIERVVPRLGQLLSLLETDMERATAALDSADRCRQELVGLLGNCAHVLEAEAERDPLAANVGLLSDLADTCATLSDAAIDPPFERFERPMWLARLRMLLEDPTFNPGQSGL